MPEDGKSLGTAIDEIIAALSALDQGARGTAIKAVCDHLKLCVPTSAPAITSESSIPYVADKQASAREEALPTDIRSLKEAKSPSSATEMACIVAYYLQRCAPRAEQKNDINASDIERYFVQAGFPLPRRTDQLLVNVKTAGYFDSAGRGAYHLNAVGHNLVAHTLPRRSGSSAAVLASRERKRSRSKMSRTKRKR